MKEFMGKDFLLDTDVAKEIYDKYADMGKYLYLITIVILIRRRYMKTDSLIILPRYGLGVTIISGGR